MEATETRTAFRELCDFLREADAAFVSGPRAVTDPVSAVEGYRHLTHLLGYALELYLEGDAAHPRFTPLASPMRKILGDNVDSLYHFAPLTGDRAYRIRGRRGNDVYLAFCVYGGKPDGEWSERVVANVSQQDIRFSPDGTFTLVLAPERPDGEAEQWVKLTPDAVCVIVRQYFAEPRDARPADLAIETLERVPAPAPLADVLVARRLRAVATFMRETLGVVPLPAFPMANILGPPMPWSPHVPGWGTPDNIYALGEFRLAPDEALVIEGRSPRCTYWGVQLWNRYMQSLDYPFHRVSINGTQAVLERDGSFRVVVAHQDPGVPNWLETAGHPEGLVFCRWLQAAEHPEQPASRVVPVSELAARPEER